MVELLSTRMSLRLTLSKGYVISNAKALSKMTTRSVRIEMNGKMLLFALIWLLNCKSLEALCGQGQDSLSTDGDF